MPFPLAIAPLSCFCGSLATSTTVSVLAPPERSWTASASSAWLSIKEGACGSGDGLITLELATNTGARREGSLQVTFAGSSPRTVPVVQASSQAVLTQRDEVMNAPMIMELGVAGKFVGKELEKIPLPYREAAIAVVVGIVEALGVAAVAGRHAFPTVPEPRDYYLPDFGKDTQPMTDLFIEKQTEELAVYIAEVANGLKN